MEEEWVVHNMDFLDDAKLGDVGVGDVVAQQSLDKRGSQSRKSFHGAGGVRSHGTCGALVLHSTRLGVPNGHVEGVDLGQQKNGG